MPLLWLLIILPIPTTCTLPWTDQSKLSLPLGLQVESLTPDQSPNLANIKNKLSFTQPVGAQVVVIVGYCLGPFFFPLHLAMWGSCMV